MDQQCGVATGTRELSPYCKYEETPLGEERGDSPSGVLLPPTHWGNGKGVTVLLVYH